MGSNTRVFDGRIDGRGDGTDRRPIGMDNSEVLRIKNDFPALTASGQGKPFIYLDSGATAQSPRSVIEAEEKYYARGNAAVHRGTHRLAEAATEAFETARANVAAFINADDDEVVWTSNATEALNLLAYAFSNAAAGLGGSEAKPFVLRPGDEILTTEMEHHANLIPWQQTAARTGATLKYIPIDEAAGTLDLEEAGRLITERTKIVTFTYASNVLGTINPVGKISAMARRQGAFVVLDACQAVPHMAVDVKDFDVDFAVFSGHKMLAPTGIGVLYGKSALLNAMPPFLTGGSMISKVTMDSAEFLPAPLRFEAGTQRVSQAIALSVAVDYLMCIGMDRIRRWEAFLGRRLVEGLSGTKGVRVLGPPLGEERLGLAAISVDGVHAHDVGQYLDAQGLAVRAGHHCAQPLHRRYGLAATTRASTYLYNTTDDVDAFIAGVAAAQRYFARR